MAETYEIPKTQMGCIFYEHGGPIEYKEIVVPKPKPTEILIKVLYSGVCHSDLHAWSGDWPSKTKLPLIGGHEGAGIVIAKGKNVNNFEIGDYAGIKWLNGSCSCCEYCEQGVEINCSKADISGYTHDGTFQQYATADATQAAHIPKGVDLAGVAPILCAGVTVYKALKVANLKAGQWVAISGAGGGLGTLAVQYARVMGLRVLAIDSGVDKSKLCKELGAEVFIDYAKTGDLVKKVIDLTNGGAHGVINVSISEKAINQSLQYSRILGCVVLIGLPMNAQIKTSLFDAVVKSIQIKGSSVGNLQDTSEALSFYVRGLVKSPIEVVGLSELPRVFELMEAGKILGRKVLDTSR